MKKFRYGVTLGDFSRTVVVEFELWALNQNDAEFAAKTLWPSVIYIKEVNNETE